MANIRKPKGLWMIGLIALMAAISLYQLTGLVKGNAKHEDAGQLLYQVSKFQMELLYSALQDAEQASDSGHLDTLKQMAYSANYTHERLVLAFGEDELKPLSFLNELLRYIMKLQIGGSRPLKASEVSMLKHLSKGFKPIYEAYDRLITTSGSIVSSSRDEMEKADREMTDYMKEKLTD